MKWAPGAKSKDRLDQIADEMYGPSPPIPGQKVEKGDSGDENDLKATLKALKEFTEVQVKRDKDYKDIFAGLQGLVKPQQRQEQAPQFPTLNLDDLPDPIREPDKFKKELAARQQKFTQDAVVATAQTIGQKQAATQDYNAKIDEVWAQFNTKYKDFADQDDIVQVQTQKLLKEAEARGVDMDTYVFGNTEKFIDELGGRVKSRLEALGWKPKSGQESGHEDESEPAKGLETQADAEDAGRTTVFQGGDFGTLGGAPAPKGKQKEGSASSLVDELRATQKRMGIY